MRHFGGFMDGNLRADQIVLIEGSPRRI